MNDTLIRRLDATTADFGAQLDRLLGRQVAVAGEVERTVAGIIERVARDGDAAVLEFTRRFDRREVSDAADLELDRQCLAAALDALEPALAAAMATAAARIRRFHESQLEKDFQIEDEYGNRLGQRTTAMERVGLYVPGGRAAYPSSVLMTAIPARVAGVDELIMVVPAPDDYLHPPVLAAAALAGVDRVFTIGGAQAVAALAVGTATVPRVDKIVGPGNVWVATAKKQVFGRVGIDMIAGPSEVLILADDSADPRWVVMDLFAQAEHDEMAQSIVVTTSASLADAVTAAIGELLPTMQRSGIITRALADHGAVVVAPDLGEAARIANRIAPEHLELLVEDPDAMLPLLRHAGAIFVGAHSAEAMGDYCAGPNHVLPTSGTARFSSPLGVYDFRKRSSVIHLSPAGAASIAQTAAVLADSEGLEAHARAARLRAGETQ